MKTKYSKHLVWALMAIFVSQWCASAWAISLKEEQQLSQEFMQVIYRHFKLIDDPLITEHVSQVGRKIVKEMAPQPFAYRFFVIKEEVYNAFAIPAGYIFINSGLLLAMESEDELAGILAHEISHVVCRHISQRIDRSKKIDIASVGGMVAGIFLGAAGAGAAAGQAIALGSLAAGQTASLAFSREDESQADQLGVDLMIKAGYSPVGLLAILKKIRGKQWFGSDQIPSYLMTHPAVEERIASIDSWMAQQPKADSLNIKAARATDTFGRIQLRLRALYGEQDATLTYFKSAVAQNPLDAGMVYGLGLTLARAGHYDTALDALQRVLAQDALNPMLLSDLGKVYFLEGRMQDALRVLSGAASLNGPNTEGLFFLGRTYMEMGDFSAAADTLEKVLQKNDTYTQTYYFLGQNYSKLGREPESHYFLGLFHFQKGDDRSAYFHLKRAQQSVQDPAKLETIKQILEIIGKLPKPEEQQQ